MKPTPDLHLKPAAPLSEGWGPPLNTADSIQVRGVKFNLVSLASLAISYMAFILLSVAFPNVHPVVIQFLGIIPATLVNYLGNSYWTFRNSPERGL
jgi:putative flippase GtrA